MEKMHTGVRVLWVNKNKMQGALARAKPRLLNPKFIAQATKPPCLPLCEEEGQVLLPSHQVLWAQRSYFPCQKMIHTM